MSLIENLTDYVGPAIYRAGRPNTPFYCNDGHCWWQLRSTPGDFLGMVVTILALSRLLQSWEIQQLTSIPTSPAAMACYVMACVTGAASTFISWSWLNTEIPFSDYGASLIEKNKCSLTELDVAAVGFLAMAIFSEIIAKKAPPIPVVAPPIVPVPVVFPDAPIGPQ